MVCEADTPLPIDDTFDIVICGICDEEQKVVCKNGEITIEKYNEDLSPFKNSWYKGEGNMEEKAGGWYFKDVH